MTTELANDVTGAPPVGISAWLGRIVCGDNTEVLSGFPDACIDLVVTSPPYDDLRTYGGHSWNFETLAAQLVRVLKPGGVIVWVVGDRIVNGQRTCSPLRQILHMQSIGLLVHDVMIYGKNNPCPQNNGKRYQPCFEYVPIFSKGIPNTFNPIMVKSKTEKVYGFGVKLSKAEYRNERNKHYKLPEERRRHNAHFYDVANQASSDAIAFEHPAIMPEALASDHISSWSNPGDVVIDPFSGSGTTCKVAKALNRQWCGIEINPEYCKIAESRLAQDVLQLETCAMRPNSRIS